MRISFLGDSIFDNKPYVEKGRSVKDHLARLLKNGDTFQFIAIDGSITRQVSSLQVPGIDFFSDYVFISTGGNDAMRSRHHLIDGIGNETLSEIEKFREEYRQMALKLKDSSRPVIVCTIYDSIPGLSPLEKTVLNRFNDVIIQTAEEFEMKVLDLRSICIKESDYAAKSPIEPSETGGFKIAQTIAGLLYS